MEHGLVFAEVIGDRLELVGTARQRQRLEAVALAATLVDQAHRRRHRRVEVAPPVKHALDRLRPPMGSGDPLGAAAAGDDFQVRISGWPKWASSEATIMSRRGLSSQPPPSA